jgi:rhodanese-related sulfurtransferase
MSSGSGFPGGIGRFTSPGKLMTSGAFGVSGIGGCSIMISSRAKMMTIKHITVQQAHQQQTAGARYLDVRSIPEFEQGHPEGAFNIPLLHFDPSTGQMRPNPEFLDVVRANFPPETAMVVGCKMGGRSQQACEILASAGFYDVTNVLGGWGGAPQLGHIGWVQAGLPVETTAEASRRYDTLQKKTGSGDR